MGLLQKIFGVFRRKPKSDDVFFEEAPSKNRKETAFDRNIDLSSFDHIDKRQEIVACCERIMGYTNAMKEEKNEYDVVTGYLKDTQVIDSLSEDDHKEIELTAARVLQLVQKRSGLLNQKQRLPEDRINDFEASADDIPQQIERLRSNEAYQGMVKRDMQYLEGEKHSWAVTMKNIKRENKLLNKALIMVLVVFVIWNILSLYVTMALGINLTLANVIVSAAVAVVAFAGFLKIISNRRLSKRSEASLNKSIVMQNRMKAKYVAVTNAVEYIYDKYDVHSSYELDYLWEQYQLVLKEREETQKANEQMEYQKKVLIRQLRRFHLTDPIIWVNQCNAILDPREMVEVRHRLVAGRQKIRARMEKQIEEIKNERKNLDFLLADEKDVSPELQQIISAIDRFCQDFE